MPEPVEAALVASDPPWTSVPQRDCYTKGQGLSCGPEHLWATYLNTEYRCTGTRAPHEPGVGAPEAGAVAAAPATKQAEASNDVLPCEAAHPEFTEALEAVVRDGSVLSREAQERVRALLDEGKPTTVQDTGPLARSPRDAQAGASSDD